MAGEWVAVKGRECMSSVFGSGWDEVSDGVFQGRCPGEDQHTKGGSGADCRIFVGYGPRGEKPGAYCLHHSCKGVLDDLNQRFREVIFAKAAGGRGGSGGVVKNAGVAREPQAEGGWIPPYDEERLRRYVRACVPVGKEFFMERSPVDPRGMQPGEFLEHVFSEGERVLVFTNFYSQGDFGWLVGRGGVRLGKQRGVKPVRSALPTDGGKDGVWYLCQPVDGEWYANARREGKYSRRSEESVTRWRHLVLESDSAPEDLWFQFLAMLEMPIKAIYSSGGKSWHALLDVTGEDYTKAQFDAIIREQVKRVMPVFGADAGALTPVRLTRLPGCTRKGRLQELVWLNPNPAMERIIDRKKVRSL